MSVIGLVGAGHIGSTVAKLAIDAGHDVVIANSRGPDTLRELVDRLGPQARAATAEEAAAAADLAVVTVPLKALHDLPARALAGTVVMDTINYYPERDGHVAALDDESTTTSELVQEQLADSRVVKVFNNIFYAHLRDLARPSGAADRSALALAGDDAAAKEQVSAFLHSIGYDALDIGPLAEGWRTQRDTAAYATVYADGDDWDHPVPTNADRLAERVAAARRYRDM